jgi:ribosomal protein S17E
MGNSMLKPLKTKAEYIIENTDDKTSTDFNKNKKAIKSLELPFSKSTVNKMSGYIVRCKKKDKKN